MGLVENALLVLYLATSLGRWRWNRSINGVSKNWQKPGGIGIPIVASGDFVTVVMTVAWKNQRNFESKS
jgi:hypothetical protein